MANFRALARSFREHMGPNAQESAWAMGHGPRPKGEHARFVEKSGGALAANYGHFDMVAVVGRDSDRNHPADREENPAGRIASLPEHGSGTQLLLAEMLLKEG